MMLNVAFDISRIRAPSKYPYTYLFVLKDTNICIPIYIRYKIKDENTPISFQLCYKIAYRLNYSKKNNGLVVFCENLY